MDGLIGHTGFVGSNLLRQHTFGACFNSGNITEATGRRFDTVVCAAAPGSMFEANRHPERDKARIESIMEQLQQIDARQLILISTIAVLQDFMAADETTEAFEQTVAYGVHRRMLEEFVDQRFEDALILRLPALFGPGLKKNFLFDILNPMPAMLAPPAHAELCQAVPTLLTLIAEGIYAFSDALGMYCIDREALETSGHKQELEAAAAAAGLSALRFTNPDSEFQYYDLNRLWDDIGIARSLGLRTLHLAMPPLKAGAVYRRLTGEDMPVGNARLHREDMRTGHASGWQNDGPYLASEDEVLDAIERFMAAEMAQA